MILDIIVCVKRVPDTETRVRFSDGATVIEPDGGKYIVRQADGSCKPLERGVI